MTTKQNTLEQMLVETTSVKNVLDTILNRIEERVAEAGKDVEFTLYDMWCNNASQDKVDEVFGQGTFIEGESFYETVSKVCSTIEKRFDMKFLDTDFHYFPSAFHLYPEPQELYCPHTEMYRDWSSRKEEDIEKWVLKDFSDIINNYHLTLTQDLEVEMELAQLRKELEVVEVTYKLLKGQVREGYTRSAIQGLEDSMGTFKRKIATLL